MFWCSLVCFMWVAGGNFFSISYIDGDATFFSVLYLRPHCGLASWSWPGNRPGTPSCGSLRDFNIAELAIPLLGIEVQTAGPVGFNIVKPSVSGKKRPTWEHNAAERISTALTREFRSPRRGLRSSAAGALAAPTVDDLTVPNAGEQEEED